MARDKLKIDTVLDPAAKTPAQEVGPIRDGITSRLFCIDAGR
jgi:hypothetical protein